MCKHPLVGFIVILSLSVQEFMLISQSWPAGGVEAQYMWCWSSKSGLEMIRWWQKWTPQGSFSGGVVVALKCAVCPPSLRVRMLNSSVWVRGPERNSSVWPWAPIRLSKFAPFAMLECEWASVFAVSPQSEHWPFFSSAAAFFFDQTLNIDGFLFLPPVPVRWLQWYHKLAHTGRARQRGTTNIPAEGSLTLTLVHGWIKTGRRCTVDAVLNIAVLISSEIKLIFHCFSLIYPIFHIPWKPDLYQVYPSHHCYWLFGVFNLSYIDTRMSEAAGFLHFKHKWV